MRRALRELGTIETDAGRLTLRMTVGVHSGRFDFFLVGGSHRELIMGGPAATEIVQIEGAATTGRIVVGEATASAIPRRSVGPPIGPGRLLRGKALVEGHEVVTLSGRGSRSGALRPAGVAHGPHQRGRPL